MKFHTLKEFLTTALAELQTKLGITSDLRIKSLKILAQNHFSVFIETHSPISAIIAEKDKKLRQNQVLNNMMVLVKFFN